ncbi:MAG: hypothetical protein OZX49_01416 [Immundisolibacter sp.]|nr:hypothetical protein [Immundisolibacter sp.]
MEQVECAAGAQHAGRQQRGAHRGCQQPAGVCDPVAQRHRATDQNIRGRQQQQRQSPVVAEQFGHGGHLVHELHARQTGRQCPQGGEVADPAQADDRGIAVCVCAQPKIAIGHGHGIGEPLFHTQRWRGGLELSQALRYQRRRKAELVHQPRTDAAGAVDLRRQQGMVFLLPLRGRQAAADRPVAVEPTVGDHRIEAFPQALLGLQHGFGRRPLDKEELTVGNTLQQLAHAAVGFVQRRRHGIQQPYIVGKSDAGHAQHGQHGEDPGRAAGVPAAQAAKAAIEPHRPAQR